jgi:hypothetical protein
MQLSRRSIVTGLTVVGLALSATPAMAKGGGDGGGDQASGTVSFSLLPPAPTTTSNSGGSNSGGGKTTVFSCAWTVDPVTGFLTATLCGPKQGV